MVAAAARSVERSPSPAYQLRRRAGEDSGFARAWDEAQARTGEQALDQAIAGVDVRMLLDEITELPNGRERCEASPAVAGGGGGDAPPPSR